MLYTLFQTDFPLSPFTIVYSHAFFYFLIYYIKTYNETLQDFSGHLEKLVIIKDFWIAATFRS